MVACERKPLGKRQDQTWNYCAGAGAGGGDDIHMMTELLGGTGFAFINNEPPPHYQVKSALQF